MIYEIVATGIYHCEDGLSELLSMGRIADIVRKGESKFFVRPTFTLDCYKDGYFLWEYEIVKKIPTWGK